MAVAWGTSGVSISVPAIAWQLRSPRSLVKIVQPSYSTRRPTELRQGRLVNCAPFVEPWWAFALEIPGKAMISAMVRYNASGISSPSSVSPAISPDRRSRDRHLMFPSDGEASRPVRHHPWRSDGALTPSQLSAIAWRGCLSVMPFVHEALLQIGARPCGGVPCLQLSSRHQPGRRASRIR